VSNTVNHGIRAEKEMCTLLSTGDGRRDTTMRRVTNIDRKAGSRRTDVSCRH